MPALPGPVQIVEVGPRDGLQNERLPFPTAAKIALIDGLAAAGLTRIEATSFVSPKAVPQLSDAAEVMAGITRRPGVEYAALVPNERGLARALDAGADRVNVVVVASETFNRRNVNMSVRQSMDALRAIAVEAERASTPVSVVIGTAFRCPFEGEIDATRVRDLVGQCLDAGITEVTLADTIGAALPAEVAALGKAMMERFPSVELGLHLHDTRGMGLANALAGVQSGYRRLESSLAGLGGCPFAPKATGNACTEEIALMLQSFGLCTEVDLAMLLEVGEICRPLVDHALPSRLISAGLFRPVDAPS